MSTPSENSQKASPDKNLHGMARAWLLKAHTPAGLEQWVGFHHSPIAQMHPTRWANTESVWQGYILQSSYACAYLDEYFRNHWNWEPGPWTDLKNPLMRFAVSSPSFLERLATFAGAFIASAEIRKAVDRKTVRLLRQNLGEEVLQFARLQAPQLNVTIPAMCRIEEWSAPHAADIVLNAGWLLIACASALLSTHEWRQFLRRLPQKIEDAWNLCNFSEEDFQIAWQCLQVLIGVMMKQDEHA